MNIILSEEIIEIEKALFEIENKHEYCFNKLLTHCEADFSNYKNCKRDGNFYKYYPFLFVEEFEKVTKEEFRTIALSGWLYFRYLLLNDKLMDSTDLKDSSNLLYINLLLEKSYSLLYSIFNSSSGFWDYFTKYSQEFTNALLLERTKHIGIVSPYLKSEFELISMGKSAMAKCATAALAILNNTPQKIEHLAKSQDYFHSAFQLNDDFEDWKEDYRNHHYSYLLTTVIYENQLIEQVESDNPPDLETIGRALYLSKVAENQMDEAILLLEKAVSFAANCHLWIGNIKKIQSQSEGLKNNVSDMREKLLSRREIQEGCTQKSAQETLNLPLKAKLQFHINRALDYVLTQQELNFREMEHKMIIPLAKGFRSKFDLQIGNIFQRSLIIDTLIDAHSFFTNADEIIKKEVELIVAAKLKNVRGGWSYFPFLPELPPDSDSLGQILQVLIRSKYKKIEDEVSDSISLLLSQCSYDDGSFETWIVDRNDTSEETSIIIKAIERMWILRMGKDNEVLANILYGLYLYDFKNLKNRIEKGVNCLEKRQTEEGYWSSTWYWGTYYGTYTAVKIIKTIKPDSSTLEKAEKYLTCSQNYDGGWGNFGSDPLNTALALLSLTLLKSKNLECFYNGINYLFSKQNVKGYWDRIEFIKMYAGGNILTYKSKTISTQFCLKALVAISYLSYLKGTTILQNKNFTTPQPQIYSLYKDFANFLVAEKKQENIERDSLLNNLYIDPNKGFFEGLLKISSLNMDILIDSFNSYKKDECLNLIEQIEKDDIESISKESIIRCFERFPLNRIPDIYLWLGPHKFLNEYSVIDSMPAIIISLELFANIQSLPSFFHNHFKNRCSIMKNTIPLIIANQYCRLILNRMGIIGKEFLYKLYEMGMAAYFSKETFPEYKLSSHLLFTSAELDWCQGNEWFLKREMKPYLQSHDKNIIEKYLFVNHANKNNWFPYRIGCFAGYKIIEEYLKKEYTLNIRDMISESPIEVVAKSRFFKI